MKVRCAIPFAALLSGASLSCHVHSSASASFSFDASFGSPVDAGSPLTNNPDASAIASASENAIDAGALPPPSDDDGGIPSDFSLRFERTACLGTCPMYVVLVNAQGAVRFSSRLFVKDAFVDGCASKNIGERGVTDLRNAIAKYGYFSLRSSYSGGPTDAPSANTSVTMNHKTKVVAHYMAAPVAAAEAARLAGIERAIDMISGAADFASKGGTLTPCDYNKMWRGSGPL